MEIRSALPQDAMRLLEIYAYYVRETAITFEYEVPSTETFQNRIANTLKAYPYLVLEDEGEIRGYAYAGFLKDRAAYQHACEVTIYLDRNARGKGYGRALYEALEEDLRSRGIINLYACISDPIVEDAALTRQSEQFHRHLGYTRIGEFHKCGRKFHRWYNMIWMEKVIGSYVEILPAPESRYGDVRGFYHALIDAMASSIRYVGWQKDVYPAPEFLRESIRRGELYIAPEGDRIAAAMVLNHDFNEGYARFHWPTEASAGEVMVIHALGVHPDFAGMGYAKALVQRAIKLARTQGAKVMRLDVLEGNLPAERLYTGSGFQYAGTLQMYYEDTGWANFRLYEYELTRG